MATQGIATETGFSTINESGAIPSVESGLPLGLPEQPDLMVSHHERAMVARFHLTSLLEQEKLVGTYEITPTTDPSTAVWEFVHTARNVLELHLRTYKTIFRLSSWKLHFKFEFRSNFQQVGQILVVQHNIPLKTLWYILGKYQDLDGSNKLSENYMLMTILPHTKVAMGEDVDVQATMNWNIPIEGCMSSYSGYQYDHESAENTYAQEIEMGRIFVIAPVKMQVALNVTPSMTVRIWSRLSNLRLAAYNPLDSVI